MSNYTEEINRRRTFAIISHPDAGKTTLTEKFLLYGGAINLAGSVKGKATARHAVSDWMQIEKDRGISVTSSVLQFEYDGYCINILDTPGHQDFSEDTYRTLMAADSAVMVIDASKGVEAQTRKLFKVCVMRKIPIFTFINKMDREARDTFELLDDIEKELGIATCPINWPIGSGKGFQGVYDREKKCVIAYSDTEKGTKEGISTEIPIQDEAHLKELIGEEAADKLLGEVELLDGASAEFDLDEVQKGNLTPVCFGSALTNFGVEIFLKHFLKMTTTPLPRKADMLGKETIATRTRGQTKGHSGSSSTNFQQTGRELMTLDEVRKLGTNQAILFIRGESPVLDEKYNIKNHPNIRLTVDGKAKPYVHKPQGAPNYALPDLPYEFKSLDDYEFINMEESEHEETEKEDDAES